MIRMNRVIHALPKLVASFSGLATIFCQASDAFPGSNHRYLKLCALLRHNRISLLVEAKIFAIERIF